MKTCSTCGAMVADDAAVCPDCGMEFESTSVVPINSAVSPAPDPVSTPAVSPVSAPSSINSGSGFTVDFGFEPSPATPAAPLAPAPVVTPAVAPAEPNPFDFAVGSTVVLNPESASAVALAAPPVPTAPTVPTARITVKRGGSPTSDSFVVSSGAIVGRFDPDSGPVDVDLAPLPEASYVSRHHAEFRHDAGNGNWYVKDMGSRNGTFWRAGSQGAFSRLTGEQQLASGDEIALGNARFEFTS